MRKSLSLYLHIPFCIRKCNYCDFLSVGISSEAERSSLVRDYVNALCAEILSYKSIAGEYIIETIFIGGGTPSILMSDDIKLIMATLRSVFRFSLAPEITIEANPGTLTKEKLEAFRESGINRLSIGLQSANDNELAMLGRIHNYNQFLLGYNMARRLGFDNINIDIMSGLPGQELRSYLDTLEKVIRLKPEHISSYSLIVEENTPLCKNRALLDTLPDEDTERKMYEMTGTLLKAAGYERYEISNYALRGKECRHNMVYWRLKEYLGFGVSAASFFKGRRFSNKRSISEYISVMNDSILNKENPDISLDAFHVIDEDINAERLMEEYMFLGLRMTGGVSAAEFDDYFGHSLYDIYGEVIKKYTDTGYMTNDGGIISLTNQGIDVSNIILSDFLLN